MAIIGTKDIIRYIETRFTVVFDKNGVMLKFEQPNMTKPESIEKYSDRIEKIKKRLFKDLGPFLFSNKYFLILKQLLTK